MNRFWNSLMLPIMRKLNAQYIVEIGSDTGINTKNILEYCRDNDARMTAIDPFPQFDINEFKSEYADKFEIFTELSLKVLPFLENYDTILIDGDHNWYTVYNELKIIEKTNEKFPLVFLHDVGWPYGRRDLYYDPDNLPDEFRQPYSKMGMYPNEPKLREKGGLNIGLNNAILENTPKNGVLTALEDFIKESNLKLSLKIVNAFFGLGILFQSDENTEKVVNEVIDKSNILKITEEHHLKSFIDLQDDLKDIISDKQIQISSLEDNLKSTNRELLKIQNELFRVQNILKKVEKTLNNERSNYREVKKELDLIYASDFWKTALKYYHIRDHVWPFSAVFKYLKNRKYKKIQNREKVLSKSKKLLPVDLKRNGSKYDIIFFSIINYDYKYHQRPQHIADFFSEKGHQVHYFNTNFSKNGTQVHEVNKNLRMVNLSSEENFIIHTNFSNPHADIYKELDDYIAAYNITDCVVFIEFPNWVYLGKYLKKKYGFKVVFDVLDDFEGFHPDDPILLQSFEDLFNTSDLVITTSTFLYEKCAKLHDNVKIVRNGVEFKHFNHFYSKGRIDNKKPVIGYYGALADWFDFDKVEYLAKTRPEYDIVLIGDVKDSDGTNIERLNCLNNLKLLGPKDYNELPHYLKTFDVALIPFKQDKDLIKATNPVKFYEYLSMGKKIVATEIPELIDYKDILLYLTNDNKVFVDNIDKCVKLEDDLAAAEKCIEFAKTKDWEIRIDKIEKHINQLFDLASIIIVTYNNLKCTQRCLESIFEKTAYFSYEIIIVDNNSTDNTRRYLLKLQDKHDNIKLILNEENLGFAKANNIGINEASGEYIIILNNDTIVTRGWLSGLIKHLERNQTLGLLGPVTNSISNRAQIKVDYTKIEDMENFAKKNRNAHINELYTDINVIAMFCLALRREVYEEIGPLDETFTVGMFEDDDYSYRAIKKGYEIACADDVFIHHYGGASFFKLKNNEYMEIFEKNKAIFEKKWKIKWAPHTTRR